MPKKANAIELELDSTTLPVSTVQARIVRATIILSRIARRLEAKGVNLNIEPDAKPSSMRKSA